MKAPNRDTLESQRGLMAGLRIGSVIPVKDNLTVTPSVQGVVGYSTALYKQTHGYFLTNLGTNFNVKWQVKPKVALGADFGIDYLWTNVHNNVIAYGQHLYNTDLFNLDRGLKHDWAVKAALSLKTTPTKHANFDFSAGYQRYQESKLAGWVFKVTGVYVF